MISHFRVILDIGYYILILDLGYVLSLGLGLVLGLVIVEFLILGSSYDWFRLLLVFTVELSIIDSSKSEHKQSTKTTLYFVIHVV